VSVQRLQNYFGRIEDDQAVSSLTISYFHIYCTGLVFLWKAARRIFLQRSAYTEIPPAEPCIFCIVSSFLLLKKRQREFQGHIPHTALRGLDLAHG